MVSLKQHLEENNYILDCPHCGKNVYRYIGIKPIQDSKVILSQDFKPMSKKVKQPTSGQKMICPFCGAILSSIVKSGW